MKKIKLILIALTITSAKFYAQVPSYVPTNGLVGWWPFNGNANDESGNSNNGTVNGATLTTDRFGVANKAYSFDGNDIITANSIPFTNLSVSIWYLASNNSAFNISNGHPPMGSQLIGQGTQHSATAYCDYALGLTTFNGPQEIAFEKSLPAAGHQMGYTSSTFNFLNWENIILTVQGTVISIYKNNTLVNTISATGAFQNIGSVLSFGARYVSNTGSPLCNFFTGKLDDIGIWNRALTQNEITALYTTTSPPTLVVSPASTTICAGSSTTLSATANTGSTVCASSQLPTGLQSGLVGYWPFCGNANDASGNGNNGTVNGATLTTDRFGNANSAYSFDGVNDYIEIPYSSLFINGQLTISYWKKDSTLTNDTDLMFGNPTSAIWCTQVGPNFVGMYNNLGCNGYDAGLTTSNFINNSWSLISFVINNNSTSLYKNGNYIGSWNSSIISNSNCNSTTYKLYLGVDIWSSSEFYKFKLDDIAIWNRILTATEIQQLYTLGQATYSWSPGGATTPSITVSPTATTTTTTTYTCTATANGVSSTATSIVTVAPAPTITSTNTSICAGQSTTLTASTTTTGSSSNCPNLSGSLNTGLVGYWPFCGNANDASGNGNNGTVNGATLTTDRFGNANSAYSFDGVNDNIIVNSLSSTNSINYSISVWANLNTGYNNGYPQHYIVCWNCTGNGVYLNIDLDQVQFCCGNLTLNQNTNEWNHFTVIKNNGVVSLYKNGSLITTNSNATQLINSIYSLYFGSTSINTEFTNGKIDDIAIWNRALTASEIQALYTTGQTTYSWSNGATTPSITVSPTTTTTYTCTVTDPSGTSCVATQTITVNPVPTVNAGADISVCSGSTATLTATGATTYSWTNNVQNGVAFTPTATNTYTVTGTSNSCTATDAVTVTVVPAPTISATSTTVCAGQSTTLTASTTSTGSGSNCPTLSGSLATGLVGYWPFCGNANDASGSGNNGTVNGATLTTDRFGNANSAYSFDGVNDYISVDGSFPLGNSHRSISAWINVNQFVTDAGIAGWGQFNNLNYSTIGVSPNQGKLFFWSYGNDITTNQQITSNQWINIVVTYDGNNNAGKIYLNGLLDISSNITPLTTLAGILNIGKSLQNNGTFFNGKLDDIGIWNRALSAAEIQQLYTMGQTTYAWSPGGAISPSITVTPATTTTYTYTVTTNGLSCPASQTITVNPLPSATISQNGSTSFCQGGSVQLCAPTGTGLTYSWSGNLGTTSCITVASSQTTAVTVTNASGCSATSAPQSVVVLGNPIANAGLDGTITCVQNAAGYQIGSTPNPTITYSWTPTTGLSNPNIANPIANPSSTTTYTLTIVNADGCTGSDQVVVTVNNTIPLANAGIDFTKTCVSNVSGATVGMTAVSGNTYSWTPTAGLSSSTVANPTANPSATTSYTLTTTNTANGCTANDQVVVTVNTAIPSVDAGLDFTKTCITNVSGATVGMTAVSGNTYSWTPTAGLSSSTVANPTANPSATTTYTLTTTNTTNGCTANDLVVVTVNTAIPSVDAGLDFTKTCVSNVNGAALGMTAVSGNTYSWTPTAGLSSSTAANPTANPSATTSYTLTTTNTANGCTANDQVVVTVNTTPPTVNAGIDQSICLGQSVTFNASTNAPNLNWNNSVQNNIPFVPNSVGSFTYIASATGSNGCTANDDAILTVNALPIAQAGLDGLITCSSNPNGASLGSNPITGETYSWTPTSGLSNATIANPIANPVSNTIYTITTTNSFGCSAIDSVFISVDNDAPILDAGNDQNICSGDSLLLLASTVSGSTITWNGNVANGSYVLPTNSSYYLATALATNGCSSVDSILVNILQPTSSILNETACDEFILNGNTYNQSGTYTQVITNNAGCDSTITLNLNIIPSPTTPVVYVQNEVNLSTDVVPGLTYQWMFCSDLMPVPGATNPSFTPTANAFYAVIVSNTCGSDTSDCAEVSTIGLNEMNSNVILVYPNPNNGEFTIEITADELGQQLSIIDINGRSIKMIQLDELVLEIEIQELARGTYWLQIGRKKPIQIVKN